MKILLFLFIAIGILEIRSNVMHFMGSAVYGLKDYDKTRDTALTNNSHINYHPHFGYTYSKEKYRFVRIYNNEVIFDTVITPNAQGFLSQSDFSFKKPKNTFRIIVLGDSYSAGNYLNHPWATTAENLLNDSNQKTNLKFIILH